MVPVSAGVRVERRFGPSSARMGAACHSAPPSTQDGSAQGFAWSGTRGPPNGDSPFGSQGAGSTTRRRSRCSLYRHLLLPLQSEALLCR
jgi:hypothetical protein